MMKSIIELNWVESLTWIINQFLTWILIFSDGKFLLNKLMIIFFFFTYCIKSIACVNIYIYICVWWYIWFTIISYFFNVMAVDKIFNSCWTTSNVPLLIDWLIDWLMIDRWWIFGNSRNLRNGKWKWKWKWKFIGFVLRIPFIHPSIHSSRLRKSEI